jgi:hypothetical protein
MTADVEFIVSKTENALLVPNAALRYEPSTLTAEEIADKTFQAELSLLSPDERAKAIAAKEKKGTGSATGSKKTTGLTSLMMGGGPRAPGGFNRGGTSSKNGTRSAVGNGAGAAGQQPAKAETKNVWYLDDRGALAVMKVTVGVSDGTNTEIVPSGELEGKKVIVKEKVN